MRLSVWLLWAVIPLSALGLSLGCGQHKNKRSFCRPCRPSFLVFAAFAGHALLGENGERAATLLGAGFIALAHSQLPVVQKPDCNHH